MYNGFDVKHVINVTDVGHLTSDADSGEDKLEKSAKYVVKKLENGEYQYELELKDLFNDSAETIRYQELVQINFDGTKIKISDIQFLESFWKTEKESPTFKSGYDMIPFVSDYFSGGNSDIV